MNRKRFCYWFCVNSRGRAQKAEKDIADMVVDATVKIVGEKKGADVDNALYDKFLDKAGDET